MPDSIRETTLPADEMSFRGDLACALRKLLSCRRQSQGVRSAAEFDSLPLASIALLSIPAGYFSSVTAASLLPRALRFARSESVTSASVSVSVHAGTQKFQSAIDLLEICCCPDLLLPCHCTSTYRETVLTFCCCTTISL